MVEHAAVNRVVEGSSPSSGANFTSRWRTTATSEEWGRKPPKCVVKRVVTAGGMQISSEFPQNSGHYPLTVR